MTTGVRTLVLDSYSCGQWGYRLWLKPLREAFLLVGYTASQMTRGPRGTRPVNVDQLVEKWIPVVVQMATAHDRDEFDDAEAQIDGLLTPILSAPIRQVREFYRKLLAAMQADKRVPMLVYVGFEAWGACMIDQAPDEGVKRLKNQLARDIAGLVEEDVRPQLPEAIARALRWRDPEQLQAVKDAVVGGAKPKLKGRESCLFLSVSPGRGKKPIEVML